MRHITAINKLVGVAIAVTSISLGFVRASDAVTITNSVDDFSNTQGKAGWYYGYYNLTGNSSSFIQMTLFDVTQNLWQESTARPPYTVLYPDGGHPSANNVSEHWAVRRWQSTIAGEATISGLLKALDEGETIGRIIVNGTAIFSQSSTGTGSYELTKALNLGDTVDFAIDPNGPDFYDTTKFTATISTQAVPEPISILSSGLALGFGGFLKRKYSKSTC
jgi:hypothetical protein